jgi:hypothetical protein
VLADTGSQQGAKEVPTREPLSKEEIDVTTAEQAPQRRIDMPPQFSPDRYAIVPAPPGPGWLALHSYRTTENAPKTYWSLDLVLAVAAPLDPGEMPLYLVVGNGWVDVHLVTTPDRAKVDVGDYLAEMMPGPVDLDLAPWIGWNGIERIATRCKQQDEAAP